MNAQEMEAALRVQQAALDRIVARNAELLDRTQRQEQVVQNLRQEVQSGQQSRQEMASVA